MYPPFDADILHYALTCSGSPTLSVAAETERAGAQLTLLRADAADNAVSTTGSLNASVTVGGDHDVAIEVSDDGETRTYVVHCLPSAFPTVNILTKTDQVSPGLLLVTLGGRFIAVYRQQRGAEVPPRVSRDHEKLPSSRQRSGDRRNTRQILDLQRKVRDGDDPFAR